MSPSQIFFPSTITYPLSYHLPPFWIYACVLLSRPIVHIMVIQKMRAMDICNDIYIIIAIWPFIIKGWKGKRERNLIEKDWNILFILGRTGGRSTDDEIYIYHKKKGQWITTLRNIVHSFIYFLEIVYFWWLGLEII